MLEILTQLTNRQQGTKAKRIIFCIAVVSLVVIPEMVSAEIIYRTDYAVLLLTSRRFLSPGVTLIGEPPLAYFGDSEIEDYIELLSATNIPFNVIYDDEMDLDILISDGRLNYTSIVITLPANDISDETAALIKRASSEFGVSIIASYNRIDKRAAGLFGIDKIIGKRFNLPCVTISVTERLEFAPKVKGDIRFGVGWKIKRHPGGYRRNIKKFYEQVRSYMKVKVLPSAKVLAQTKRGYPAIIENQYGRGKNYYISLHSDFFLDQFNPMHRIVRGMIEENSGNGMVYFDMQNMMVLRIDDPGSCQTTYHEGKRNLKEGEWKKLVKILGKHRAFLTVMYVPCWVDDGNLMRGKLFYKGGEVKDRKGGSIFDSRNVVYIKNLQKENKEIYYDYTSEFRGIKYGVDNGRLFVESHGLTHLDIDIDEWLKSKDKYSNRKWYREFRHVYKNSDVSKEQQYLHMKESAEKIRESFGQLPIVITPAGYEQSQDTEHIARRAGFRFFSSEYNSLLKKEIVIRNDKVPSVYMTHLKPDKDYSESGYPLVGVFHDYDIVNLGVTWLDNMIRKWKENGMEIFVPLEELASYLLASITGYELEDRVCFIVDISDTGMSEDYLSEKYFSNHLMRISVKIPKQKIPIKVEVNGEAWNNFTFDKITRKVEICLPAFHKESYHSATVYLNEEGNSASYKF